MIKEGLIHQATGVQLLMNAMEWMPAKELPGLMQRLQKEFGPVGVASQSAAPSQATAAPAPAPGLTPSTTPVTPVKIKAEHGDPFQVQLISKRKVEGDVVSYTYQCPLCNDPPTPQSMPAEPVSTGINRHLGCALLCTVCSWSSYNLDTLKRHIRNKHT